MWQSTYTSEQRGTLLKTMTERLLSAKQKTYLLFSIFLERKNLFKSCYDIP